MDAELYQRVTEIVAIALEFEGEERRQYVREACASNDELRREVESLLELDDASGERFLEEPLEAELTAPARAVAAALGETVVEGQRDDTYVSPTAADELPDTVGPFRVLGLLGQGGMGAVYLAAQDEPVHREIAVKVIRADVTAPHAAARFDLERQALARLSHPHIAQLYHAGTTGEGYPYFAMEHCSGVAVTDYCDQHRLPVEQRLELFITVCEAVQHAHQRGIIHRDLKPSNILVTEIDGKPSAKIIDFGIAKAVDQPLAESMDLTGDRIIGTPAFMSPESLGLGQGSDIDTRTDVYALGVVLFELLIGMRPFTVGGGGLARFLTSVANEPTPRPSERLGTINEESRREVAQARQIDASALHRRLLGDLDWIVATAVAKDREERYGSPAELAADVRRHLDHQPVEANPPSVRYQLGKFIRRHRALVAAAFLVFLALVAGVVGTSSGLFRARRALAEAEAVSALMVELFEEADPKRSMGEELTVRELLDQGARTAKRRLANQPEARIRFMNTIGSSYMSLAAYDEAEEQIREVIEYWASDREEHLLEWADATRQLAVIHLGQKRNDEARQLFDEVEETLGERLRDLPELKADLESNRAVLDYFEGRFPEARERLMPAIAYYESEEAERELARTIYRLAQIEMKLGNHADGERLHRRCLTLRESLHGPNHPDVASSHHDLGLILRRMGRYDEAASHLERALEIKELLYGPEHDTVAKALNSLGVAHMQAGRSRQAKRYFDRALQIRLSTQGPDHPGTVNMHINLASIASELGELDRASEHAEEALRVSRMKGGPDHPKVGLSSVMLGRIRDLQGRSEEAVGLLEQAVMIYEKRLGPNHPDLAEILGILGVVQGNLGYHEVSEGLLLRALGSLEAAQAVEPSMIADVKGGLAALNLELSRLDRAETYAREAVELYREAVDEDHPSLAKELTTLAQVLRRQGRVEEADILDSEVSAIRATRAEDSPSPPT